MINSKVVSFDKIPFLDSFTAAFIPYTDEVSIRKKSITARNRISIGEMNKRAGTTIANTRQIPMTNTPI